MKNRLIVVHARGKGRVRELLCTLLVRLVGWISTTYHSAVGRIVMCGVLRSVFSIAMSGMEERRNEGEEGRQGRGRGTNPQDRKEGAGSGGRYLLSFLKQNPFNSTTPIQPLIHYSMLERVYFPYNAI